MHFSGKFKPYLHSNSLNPMKGIWIKSLWVASMMFCSMTVLWAQGDSMTQFNVERLSLNKIAMLILGGWTLGNILVNGFLLTRPKEAVVGHFYKMNIFWNLVNLGLAIPGLRYALITLPQSLGLTDTLSEFHEMSQVLLFNAGLDVAYITGGFLLMEMSKSRVKKHAIFKGYGRSLVLQGGFLLLFDAIFFFILQSRRTELYDLINQMTSFG